MKLIEVQVGSRMWGLERPDSDVDTRSVEARSFSEVISPWESGRIIQKKDGDQDSTVYDLHRFCKHATNGNPTMMEILFAEEKNVLFRSPFWKGIDPIWFIDDERIARAHLGFAQSQRDQIVTLWKDKVGQGKRIGKALSSGILSLRAGAFLLQYRMVSHELNSDELQFHKDLRTGHRLTEGSEELDEWRDELENMFTMLPLDSKKADRQAIEDWVADFYAGMAYWERWPDKAPGFTEVAHG